jgi:hypothetical protein
MKHSNKEVAAQLIKDISTASRMVGRITDRREYLNDQALQSIVSDYRTSIKEMTQALLELVSEFEAASKNKPRNADMTNQEKIMGQALIDLTQSNHEETAVRARAALFDAGVIANDSDGGIAECRDIHSRSSYRLQNGDTAH